MTSLVKLKFFIKPLTLILLSGNIYTSSADSHTNKLLPNLPMMKQVQVYPTLDGEGENKPKSRFKLPTNEFIETKTCRSTKRNEIFELASIINDKLQQILASLHQKIEVRSAHHEKVLLADQNS